MDSKRLKIVFDEKYFKSTPDFPLKTWFLLPSNLKFVTDLNLHIIQKFELKKECPHGIIIQMDGFVVPSTQDINIIRENDTIVIQKRETPDLKRGRSAAVVEDNKVAKKAKVPEKPTTIKPSTVVSKPAPVITPKPTAKPVTSKKVEDSSSSDSSSEESETSSSGYSSDSEEEEEETPKKIATTAKTTPATTKTIPTEKTPKTTNTTQSKTVSKQSTTTPITPKPTTQQPTKKTTETPQKTPQPTTPKPSPQQQKPNNKPTVVTTSPKGHIRFDAEGNIMTVEQSPINNTNNKTNNNNNNNYNNNNYNNDNSNYEYEEGEEEELTPKPRRTRGGRKKKMNAYDDVLENYSVILKNPPKPKPLRDYTKFTLFGEKEYPQEGDHVSFNVVDLVGWQPAVILKEGTIESADKHNDQITIRIDEAFRTTVEQESEETGEVVETETPPVVILSREQMLELRLIKRDE